MMSLARASVLVFVCLFAILGPWRVGLSAESLPEIELTPQPGELVITIGGQPCATYYYDDREIGRPYFAHVRTLDGVQVTRSHPPVAGKDPSDHATMHPGLWMAFGDLGGSDYWRNKARVVHEDFLPQPLGSPGTRSFAVRNAYLAADEPSKVICRETCCYTFRVRPEGYLILWDSTFTPAEGEIVFGDQEEMGLGVRVATPITEKAGGTIRNSAGLTGAKQAWGQAADWCDYRGTIDGRSVGVTLMCHADNFRPSWFHVRDYGLMLANPFGRNAFKQGPESRVTVRSGESLRLRYGVLIHSGPFDPAAAHAGFLQIGDWGPK